MKISTTVFFLTLFVYPLLANTIYVRQGNDGDGSSWNTAFGQLTFALQNAQSGDTILISAGTYFPTTNNDRTATFSVPDNVYLRGGYATTGTPTFVENDPQLFPTILSGNIGDTAIAEDNSFTVVTINELTGTTILEGLIIQSAHASISDESTQFGGGLFFQSTVSTVADGLHVVNCIFRDNQAANGGAIYTLADSVTTQITVRNCQFIENIAKFGAALHHESRNLGNLEISVQNTQFAKNKSIEAGGAITNYANGGNVLFATSRTSFIENEGVLGGAIYNFPTGGNLNADIENCIFSQNIGESGGGLENFAFGEDRLQLNLRSCTFNGNRAEVGAAVSIFGAGVNLQATNTIFWGNTASDEGYSLSSQFDAIASLQNCLIEEENCGGLSFNNTICRDVMYHQDPLFVDTINHNLSVLPCSPVVDNGVLNIGGTDFADNPRIVGERNDIGAYEVQSTSEDTILYVNNQSVNLLQDGTSWETAFSSFNAALHLAKTCGFATEIWLAEGTYYPTTDTTRDISFQINHDLKIYGGFAGTERALTERDFTNRTVLSGNIGDPADSTDNTNVVLKIAADVLLDNVTIRDGYARANGGGVWIDGTDTAAVRISHCQIINNTTLENGGGIALENNAQLIIEDSRITENTAANFGGALYRTLGTNAVVRNCFFLRNRATTGGAIYQTGNFLTSAEMTLVNSILAQNTAIMDGGAIYNAAATSTLVNCTVADNQATNGAAIYTVSANDITQSSINTIFANNVAANEFVFGLQARGRFDYCLLSGYEDCPEGASCEESIMNAAPLFDSRFANEYRILYCSPANGTANIEIAPEIDIYGAPRAVDNTFTDMGAVENSANADLAAVIEVAANVGCSANAMGQILIYPAENWIYPVEIAVNGDTIMTLNVASDFITIDDLPVGIYEVEISESTGCMTTQSLTIAQEVINVTIDLSIANPIKCADGCSGAINLNLSDTNTTLSYQWSDGGTNQNRENLCAGQYFVTVTDENGCTVIDSIEIIQPEPIDVEFTVVNASTGQSADGSISITTTGGTAPYTYSWDNGIGEVQNPTDLAAGTYNLIVTDANDCTEQLSVEVLATGDALVFQNIEISNLLCNADSTGAIDANISGGEGAYIFDWSPVAANINALENLPAGDYGLTVTDEVGAQIDTLLTITEPVALVANFDVITNVSCFGACDAEASLIVTGGTAPYAYLWGDGNNFPQNLQLCAGDYSVTVMDANNCTIILDSIIITQPDSLQVEIMTVEDTGAGDGAVFADVNGGSPGYAFQWTDAAGNEIGSGGTFIQNLAAGEYCLMVTDFSGCSKFTCDTVKMTTNTVDIVETLDWNIYPIPAQDYVHMELNFPLEKDWKVQVLDVNGRILQQQKVTHQKMTLPIENLPAGIFYIKLSNDNQLTISRLIKI